MQTLQVLILTAAPELVLGTKASATGREAARKAAATRSRRAELVMVFCRCMLYVTFVTLALVVHAKYGIERLGRDGFSVNLIDVHSLSVGQAQAAKQQQPQPNMSASSPIAHSRHSPCHRTFFARLAKKIQIAPGTKFLPSPPATAVETVQYSLSK